MRKSTHADRLHRFLDTAESGDDHRPQGGVALERVAEHLHAVAVRQPEIHHQAVIGKAFEAGPGVGGVARFGRRES